MGSARHFFRFVVVALLAIVVLAALPGCEDGENEHFANARESERKLLMGNTALTYAAPGYLSVARELEQVPPWSGDHQKAQEKLALIKDARRIQASKEYQLDYLPSRLDGVTLAALAPTRIDERPLRRAEGPEDETHHDFVPVVQTTASKKGTESKSVLAKQALNVNGTQAKRGEGVRERKSSTSRQTRQVASAAASDDGLVIMYTTSWCGYCRKARNYFRKNGIPFIDKDIEEDAAAQREMIAKVGGRSGVPVIDIDGIIIRGFNVRAIEQALARRDQ